MRKILTILLIVIAIPLYAWDVYLLLAGFHGGGRGGDESVPAAAAVETPRMAALPVVRFVKKGRSPFLAEAPKPKPVVKKAPAKKRVARKPQGEVKPPRVTITGIMWNPSNPVAMLTLPDGSSTVAKAGQELSGGIAVKAVEKNAVVLRYEGREFRIKK